MEKEMRNKPQPGKPNTLNLMICAEGDSQFNISTLTALHDYAAVGPGCARSRPGNLTTTQLSLPLPQFYRLKQPHILPSK
jgi:hypothetical protein